MNSHVHLYTWVAHYHMHSHVYLHTWVDHSHRHSMCIYTLGWFLSICIYTLALSPENTQVVSSWAGRANRTWLLLPTPQSLDSVVLEKLKTLKPSVTLPFSPEAKKAVGEEEPPREGFPADSEPVLKPTKQRRKTQARMLRLQDRSHLSPLSCRPDLCLRKVFLQMALLILWGMKQNAYHP